MSAKRNKKLVKPEPARKEPEEKSFRLEQPIQTALYAKLGRLGYDT
jgi:hypothetical protein